VYEWKIMIANTNRFHGQNGLMYVYRKGQTIRTKHCAAKFVVNQRASTYRIAVVISKKNARTAPLRNRIRRRIYEQMRLLAPQYLANQDVVVTVFDAELAVCPGQEIVDLAHRLLSGIAPINTRAATPAQTVLK
jgi:ribonuclease P protein component